MCIGNYGRGRSTGSVFRPKLGQYNLYVIARRYRTRFAVRFSDAYVSPGPKWRRWFLEVCIEVWTPFLSPLPKCIAVAGAWVHCMAYIDSLAVYQ